MLDREWLAFHDEAFRPGAPAELPDAGEFRYRKTGRPHANNPEVFKALHAASGYAARGGEEAGSTAAYEAFAHTVNERAADRRSSTCCSIVPHGEVRPARRGRAARSTCCGASWPRG